jgi:hypothetical protein
MLQISLRSVSNLMHPLSPDIAAELGVHGGTVHAVLCFNGMETSVPVSSAHGFSGDHERNRYAFLNNKQPVKFFVSAALPVSACVLDLKLVLRDSGATHQQQQAQQPPSAAAGEHEDRFLGSVRIPILDWGRLRPHVPLKLDLHLGDPEQQLPAALTQRRLEDIAQRRLQAELDAISGMTGACNALSLLDSYTQGMCGSVALSMTFDPEQVPSVAEGGGGDSSPSQRRRYRFLTNSAAYEKKKRKKRKKNRR